jgi:DMSO/TMAO reductase YedYZ molybdopterin-dependent catalytic subunit
MKRSTFTAVPAIALLVLLTAGCAGVPAAPEASTGEAERAVPVWEIELSGYRDDVFDSICLEESKSHRSHYVTRELERKGERTVYRGMPIHLVIAMVDGTDAEHPYLFDRELWEAGYDITLTAADGYAATFNTAEYDWADIIIADEADGQAVSPMVVGAIPSSLWVKDLVRIDAALGEYDADAAREAFIFQVDINGVLHEFSIQELEASPLYVEGEGYYTTSAGSTYGGIFGGVKLADLIQTWIILDPDNSVTFSATDGYEMTYTGSQIMDTSDGGEWILAFKLDGEYLPHDPGFIRTVKVGPGAPNILGHTSVRMVKKISVREEAFREFTISMTGKMDFELEAHDIQSGVSCHRTTVVFEHRGQSNEYTGIPLWMMLAYSDHELYAPHRQDSSIVSYNRDLALEGYQVEIRATDGFSVTLDSRDIDMNSDVIIAMYKNGEFLPDGEWPLILVWDKDAEKVPEGIKNVRQISGIHLKF